MSQNKDLAINLYFQDISAYTQLSSEEELELIKLAQKGNKDARNAVVLASTKLVTKLAGDYNNDRIHFLDFVQEGNIALMNAVMKYDVKSKNKFSTYAAQAIKTAFRDLCDREYRRIRLPANICRIITKVNKYKLSYLQDNYCEPDVNDLVEYSNGNLSKDDIETALAYTYKEESLDAYENDVFGYEIDDYAALEAKQKRAVKKALKYLSDEEFESLDYVFNLTTDHSKQENIYSDDEVNSAINHLAKIMEKQNSSVL